jgi:tetratricopeptide (TPR) repeat protein
MRNGKPQAAARAFRRALGSPFQDRRARLNLLRAYGRMGDFRSAIALAGDSLQRYPEDIEILYLLGRHQILGGFDRAVQQTIATLEQLGENDPQAADSARRLREECGAGGSD